MTWAEREQCPYFIVRDNGTSTDSDTYRREKAEEYLKATIGEEGTAKIRKHPYIKAIQRLCNPPWYVKLFSRITYWLQGWKWEATK